MNLDAQPKGWWSCHWFGAGLAAILIFSAAARLCRIDGMGGYDDGVYLMAAWLLSKGYHLYTEIAVDQFPMFMVPAGWLFSLLGPSEVLARAIEVAYSLAGIAAVAYTGKLLWQPAAGLAAGLFLSLAPVYFVTSRQFIGSVSSAAVTALAVLCSLLYYVSGRRRWLIVAGLAFSLSLLIKPIAWSSSLVFVWVIVARRWGDVPANGTGLTARLRSLPWRATWLDFLSLGLAGLVLPAICLALFNGPAMLRLILDVESRRATLGAAWVEALLGVYLYRTLPLLLLAAWGLILIARRRPDGRQAVPVVWLGLGLATFLVWGGVQTHHRVLLDLPVALLAARSIGELGTLRGLDGQHWWRTSWSGILSILLIGYYVANLPWLAGYVATSPPQGQDQPLGRDAASPGAIQLLQQVTTPDQFVVTDSQGLAFAARRMVPPALADTSQMMIDSGVVSEQTVRQVAEEQGAALVLWSNRFADSFPTLERWARETYSHHKDFLWKQVIYYQKRASPAENP